MRAIRAATRRAASTSTARRSSRRSSARPIRASRRRAGAGRQPAVRSGDRRPPMNSASNTRAGRSPSTSSRSARMFENFQLNTFNGSVFLVQNINGCDDRPRHGADRDLEQRATGACAADDDVGYGVRSRRRRAGGGDRSAPRPDRPHRRPHLCQHPLSRTIWSATTPARRSIRRCASCRATTSPTRPSWSRPARSPGRPGSAIRA